VASAAKSYTSMNASQASALWASKQKASGLMFQPRMRDVSGSVISLVKLDALPKAGKDKAKAVFDCLGINNISIAGREANFGAICHTHNTAVLVTTRHQATFGLRKTSAYDARTPKQKLESRALPKNLADGWCKGCVSAYKASL